MFCSDEGTKLGLSGVKVIVTILGNVYGITPVFDVGTDMCSLVGSFDGSNDGKRGGLFIGYSLGYTDGTVLGYDEGIKM